MDISVEKAGDKAVLAVSGDVDLQHSANLRTAIVAELDRGAGVLLDLRQVSFIDSSGIAALVQGLTHARGRGLGLALVGATDPVLRILRLTRLDAVFPMYASVEEAQAG